MTEDHSRRTKSKGEASVPKAMAQPSAPKAKRTPKNLALKLQTDRKSPRPQFTNYL